VSGEVNYGGGVGGGGGGLRGLSGAGSADHTHPTSYLYIHTAKLCKFWAGVGEFINWGLVEWGGGWGGSS
jgi:hypothetical protein